MSGKITRVKKIGGGFKLAAVKRNPFDQSYIDLTTSQWKFADDTTNDGTDTQSSTFDRFQVRGVAAVQRSEIIKAQCNSLQKIVGGALRNTPPPPESQAQKNDTTATRESDQRSGQDVTNELVRSYEAALARDVPSPVLHVGDLALPTQGAQQNHHKFDSAPDVKSYSSALLLRSPHELAALLAMSGKICQDAEDIQAAKQSSMGATLHSKFLELREILINEPGEYSSSDDDDADDEDIFEDIAVDASRIQDDAATGHLHCSAMEHGESHTHAPLTSGCKDKFMEDAGSKYFGEDEEKCDKQGTTEAVHRLSSLENRDIGGDTVDSADGCADATHRQHVAHDHVKRSAPKRSRQSVLSASSKRGAKLAPAILIDMHAEPQAALPDSSKSRKPTLRRKDPVELLQTLPEAKERDCQIPFLQVTPSR